MREDDEKAIALRASGMKYDDIGKHFGVSSGVAWKMCNRAQANRNSSDSTKRYIARGRIAIVDLPEGEWPPC